MTEKHQHVFNSISGYCKCGLQYCPHLLEYFAQGGVIGETPPAWMADTRQRFVTTLPEGAIVRDWIQPSDSTTGYWSEES